VIVMSMLFFYPAHSTLTFRKQVDKLRGGSAGVSAALEALRCGLGLDESGGPLLAFSSVTGEGTSEAWRTVREAVRMRIDGARGDSDGDGGVDGGDGIDESVLLPPRVF